jgi:hypothetical protein
MAPKQKPGKSEQIVQTPPDLLRAIRRDFRVDTWTADLAANASNKVTAYHFGPGSPYSEDSLQTEWPSAGDLWLNPPFGDIDPWAKKCATKRSPDARIFMLVPASTGANWFVDHVLHRAHVVALSPRVTFTGHSSPYPKDLILAVFSNVVGGVSAWRWKP